MEYNIDEKFWGECRTKLDGWGGFPSSDGLNEADPEERKARAKNFTEMNMYMYNFCSFGGTFNLDTQLPNHDLYKELFPGPLRDMERHRRSASLGHYRRRT